jgi:MFS transporter, DHA2 family, multidrug resistance protein
MLDRGQLKDWFSSSEIWIEATVAAVAFYLFVIHMLTTTQQRFVSPALFKDRNFLTGNVFIFIVGLVLFATLALLPPLLQDLLNYPVVTTGLVTAPRGVGTGFVYVPLAAATFATLRPALRDEGTAIFSLTRNVGSSIGISVVNTLLTRNTQIMHATLAEHVSRYSSVLRAQLPGGSPTLQWY